MKFTDTKDCKWLIYVVNEPIIPSTHELLDGEISRALFWFIFPSTVAVLHKIKSGLKN
jgi:hypothetical protein